LGYPIQTTDINRIVQERSEYSPFGALLNRPISDSPGFTGHVMDAAKNLSAGDSEDIPIARSRQLRSRRPLAMHYSFAQLSKRSFAVETRRLLSHCRAIARLGFALQCAPEFLLSRSNAMT
jgi:hypothetical protein